MKKIKRVKRDRKVVNRRQINHVVRTLGKRITRDLKAAGIRDVIVLCILKGAMFFCADLMRAMTIPMRLDTLRVRSYGNKTESSGKVRITRKPELDLRGQAVLIVEDIADSGQSLRAIHDRVLNWGAVFVRTVVLFDKPNRQVEYKPDYVGMEVPCKFLIGGGLDFDEWHREYPDVWTATEI